MVASGRENKVSMNSQKLTILVSNIKATDYVQHLIEQIQAIAADACIVTDEDLKTDPSLIGRIEIVLGSLDRSLFPQAHRLKWLQATGAGMEWAQHPEIMSHPVILTNAHIHAVQISEHLFGMLLMLTRRLQSAYRQQLERVWQRDTLLSDLEIIAGKTLCVVGLGNIGRRCAMLGKAHEMRVIGVRNHPQATPYVERVYGPDKIREALSQADVVIVVLPSTPHTGNLIGHREFAAMPKGVFFLNGGRGQTVHTDALVEALGNGTVKGAGLDVVDPEPLPSNHPLWKMANVIITPHTSGSFPRYNESATHIFLDNLRRYVKDEPLQFVVNKNKGY